MIFGRSITCINTNNDNNQIRCYTNLYTLYNNKTMNNCK